MNGTVKKALSYSTNRDAEKNERLREMLMLFVGPCIEHCHSVCEGYEKTMEECACFQARTLLED